MKQASQYRYSLMDDSSHQRVEDNDLEGFASMYTNPFKDYYQEKNMNININYNQIKSKSNDMGTVADHPTPLDTMNGSFFSQLNKNTKQPKTQLNNEPPLMISEIVR